MQKYDVHFCLVSGQAAPNLFPISDARFRPNEIVLLVSADMQKQAEHLKKIFRSQKIAISDYPITQPFDFECCEEEVLSALLDFVGEKEIDKLNIALNMTGGTKPMSFAAYSVFSAYGKGKDAFYVDTDNKRFSFLTNKENSFVMQLELKVRNYLAAYGYETIRSERQFSPKINQMFEEFFITNFHQNKHRVSKLNGYAFNGDKTRNYVHKFDNKDDVDTALYNFLYDLKGENVIGFTEKQIDFKNENTHKLLSGGWLEHFVFQEVKKLDGIDDVEMNVECSNEAFDKNKKDTFERNQGRKNEFDIAFITNNKLHIIECKTKRMNKDGEEDETQDIIHKLKSLRDNTGLMTKGCLVTYASLPLAIKNRANDEQITIIEASQLQALGSHLKKWIEEDDI